MDQKYNVIFCCALIYASLANTDLIRMKIQIKSYDTYCIHNIALTNNI